MKRIAHYLPVILLSLSTIPCFSALKQDTNSQSLISFRDFSQQMPKSKFRMSAVDNLKKKKKKSFHELNLNETEYGYSINGKNPFLAMEISLSKETTGQIRWVAPSRIKGSHVKAIVLYLQKHNQSIHINTGGHGGKDGKTVFDDPYNKADVGFIKEDIQTIWNTPNVSFHSMSSYSPAIYPRGANHVIDGWCYSLCTSLKVSLRHFSPDLRKKSLIAVAANDCLNIVKYLLPKVSQKGKDGALRDACRKGHIDVVKVLYPHASWSGKYVALGRAAEKGHLDVVKELLPHVDQRAKDNALWYAAGESHLEVVKTLLPHVNDQEIKNEALCWASKNLHLEVVKYLLPHATQDGKNAALGAGAYQDCLEVVKELLPHVNDQEIKNYTLASAAKTGNLEVVKELLPHASQEGKNEALQSASIFVHHEVVKYLLPYTSQEFKDKALKWAVKYRHLENVKELFPHASQEAKNTVHWYAAWNGDLEVLAALKNAGAKMPE